MKKKTAIFFLLLFACTMAFSFGLATSAYASTCCYLPAEPNCTAERGILSPHNICGSAPIYDSCYAAAQCW